LVAAAAAGFVSYWWLQRMGMPWPLLVSVGSVGWLLTRTSGVDPMISGRVLGLSSPAYSRALESLEHASRGMRCFR
jgi:hypothetical protein